MMESVLSLVLLLFALSSAAKADIEIPYIAHLELAKPNLWKEKGKRRLPRHDIPESLISTVNIDRPSRAYAEPFKEIYFQNEEAIVCLDSCAKPQAIHFSDEGTDTKVSGNGRSYASQVRLANTYYWTTQLFQKMSELGFHPKNRLVIMVDRNVADEITANQSTNNAFFNDRDWTLSFLPSSFSLLTGLTMKTALSYSASDPSVILHEATHSVFQEIMGSIINPEVLGLHEAFADYFSMSILETDKIGQIMTEGKFVRTAHDIIPYKNGMEAHDLGNVVSSALWKTRQLFKNPATADRVALNAIGEVSKNLYASAGSVVNAYIESARKYASSEISENPQFLEQIKEIWKATLLPADRPVEPFPTLPIDPALEPLIHFTKLTTIPDQVVRDYGESARVEVNLKFFNRVSTSHPDLDWYLVSASLTDSQTPSVPIWVLYDKKMGGISVAYSTGGELIEKENGDRFEHLKRISAEMSTFLSMTSDDFTKEYKFFTQLDTTPYVKSLFDVVHTTIQSDDILINGKPYGAVLERISISPSAIGRLILLLDGADFDMIVAGPRELTLITVDAGAIKNSMSLPSSISGRTIVGLEFVTGGGIKTRQILNAAK